MERTITFGGDGYFHPESEVEIQDAVRSALQSAPPKQIRVRGSAHSVAQAIYTDGYSGEGDLPDGPINVLLDRLRAIGPITPIEGDPDHAMVEVEAGCNLGKNPYDLTGTSTWENSLNYALQQAGWALDDLGGISHQTVAGFLSTGSSGGSLMYTVDDNIVGFNLIDGTGKLWVLNRDDPDPAMRDMFFAAGVSMGLLGVISKVRFRVRRAFNLSGSQDTGPTSGNTTVDLFGGGSSEVPSLEKFLRDTPYTRLMWWPQYGFERVQVWYAQRTDPTPGFTPNPYVEIEPVASLAGSLFYTIIGNLDDISAVPGKLIHWLEHLNSATSGADDVNACSRSTPEATIARKITLEDVLAYFREHLRRALVKRSEALAKQGRSLADMEQTRALLGTRAELSAVEHESDLFGDALADIITRLVALLLEGALSSKLAQVLASFFKLHLPFIIGDILRMFVQDGSQAFKDTWMCGLPMDNQMDDQLWPTWFTELWIPVEKTAEVMQAMKAHYAGSGDPRTAYADTGAFSCELYAAKKSDFWMSPSYGADMFRVDVFWFALNGADITAFYKPFWDLLKPFGFRPHWGKFMPPPSSDWVTYYSENFPMMDRFLKLRAQLDPQQVFVTDYWRQNLGISR